MVDLPAGLLPSSWVWAGSVTLAPVLWRALRSAPWARLRDPQQLHVYLGACVALLLLWSIRAGISPGLSLHLLGVTALSLMFGWQLATLGAVLVVLGLTVEGDLGWDALPWNVLVLGALPAWLTSRVLAWSQRVLPSHFFIYIFVNAFLGAGLCAIVSTTAQALLLSAAGVYAMAPLLEQYLQFLPLVFLPEGLLNGMVITLLVSQRPGWVLTFDDRRYLQGK